MVEIIVAVFDSERQADLVESDLRAGGVPGTLVRRYAPGDADAPETSGVPPSSSGGGFLSWLFGSPSYESHEDQGVFEEHLERGRTIISVHVVDRVQGSEVMRILEGRAPSEIEAQSIAEPDQGQSISSVKNQLDTSRRTGDTQIRRYVMPQPESGDTM